ncbi:rhomboid family intramembrane serine protease [Jeotgalibacillus sp. ET6]|uniref:rhomboid family intramembrane serine protease n=1 Tax=Jeotgalibacillus sp. ET6 TaxID=3037260 RepID=UPI002418A72C|nr:rhomboid family intramembrane serine protease [Jeotgalibacillus sp. ET6]MDG5470806.1 rhomboid family intramembrane serine protease [Jeotgalibacillus sp. ET6]
MIEKTYKEFWHAAYYLLIVQQYRLISLSPDHNELWFESGERKDSVIVRLYYSTSILATKESLDEFIQEDKSSLFAKSEEIRKHVKKRKITIENCLFLHFPEIENEERNAVENIEETNERVTVRTTTVTLFTDSVSTFDNRLQFKSSPEEADLEQDIIEHAHMYKKAVQEYVEEQKKEEQELFNASKPFWSYLFIAVHLIVFYLLERNGGSTNTRTLIDFGAKYNPLINEGEWFRLITPMFLHIGFLHLFMNTLALFYLGPLIERIFGGRRFLIIYMTAGFTGSLMSYVFSFTISAGASGAIFGCFGALLYFGLRHTKIFFRTMGTNVLVVIGINLAFGFTIPGIDNAAHIGGLAGGFLAAGFVALPNEKNSAKKVLYFLTVLIWVSLSVYAGLNGSFVQKDPMSVNALAQESIKNGELEMAYSHLSALEKNGEATPETYFLLAFIQLQEENYEDGRVNLEKAIDDRGHFHEAHYNLALVYLELGDSEKALTHAETALSIEPDHGPYEELVTRLKDER